MLKTDELIIDQFKIIKKIGAGSFGQIYLADNKSSNKKVAIKAEHTNASFPLVLYEANVTLLLNGDQTNQTEGFAKVYNYGTHKKSYYMVMDLMGPSLADLFHFCGDRFSLKTTLIIGQQLLERFKYMHELSFIHRDIKPDNFLMGLGDKSQTVHVVDMGLAKRVLNHKTGEHIEYSSDKVLTGTASYASIHSHQGEELSRRDDLEALGYVLIYFLLGTLPWQNMNFQKIERNEKYKIIKEMKTSITIEQLTKDCPSEFTDYMNYCRKLKFKEKPDYTHLQNLFSTLATKEGINLDERVFDWSVKATCIKKFPKISNRFINQNLNPFNCQGKFSYNNKFEKDLEQQLYAEALKFEFSTDTKQLSKIVNKLEFPHEQPRTKKYKIIESQIEKLKMQKQNLMEQKARRNLIKFTNEKLKLKDEIIKIKNLQIKPKLNQIYNKLQPISKAVQPQEPLIGGNFNVSDDELNDLESLPSVCSEQIYQIPSRVMKINRGMVHKNIVAANQTRKFLHFKRSFNQLEVKERKRQLSVNEKVGENQNNLSNIFKVVQNQNQENHCLSQSNNVPQECCSNDSVDNALQFINQQIEEQKQQMQGGVNQPNPFSSSPYNQKSGYSKNFTDFMKQESNNQPYNMAVEPNNYIQQKIDEEILIKQIQELAQNDSIFEDPQRKKDLVEILNINNLEKQNQDISQQQIVMDSDSSEIQSSVSSNHLCSGMGFKKRQASMQNANSPISASNFSVLNFDNSGSAINELEELEQMEYELPAQSQDVDIIKKNKIKVSGNFKDIRSIAKSYQMNDLCQVPQRIPVCSENQKVEFKKDQPIIRRNPQRYSNILQDS